MAITTIDYTEEDLTAHGLNVSGMSELEFRVLACKDAHVRLMYDRTNTTHKFIEVAFGHHGNKFIGIRDRKHGVVVGDLAFYAGSYLDCFNWKFFRVCKYCFFVADIFHFTLKSDWMVCIKCILVL